MDNESKKRGLLFRLDLPTDIAHSTSKAEHFSARILENPYGDLPDWKWQVLTLHVPLQGGLVLTLDADKDDPRQRNLQGEMIVPDTTRGINFGVLHNLLMEREEIIGPFYKKQFAKKVRKFNVVRNDLVHLGADKLVEKDLGELTDLCLISLDAFEYFVFKRHDLGWEEGREKQMKASVQKTRENLTGVRDLLSR